MRDKTCRYIFEYIISLVISIFTVYIITLSVNYLSNEFQFDDGLFRFFGKNTIYFSMLAIFMLVYSKKERVDINGNIIT